MAKEIIDIGTVANDGTGDSPRAGGVKINANFTEVYAGLNIAPTTVSTATYTVLAADRILHVTRTATGACVVTIPMVLITSTFNLLIKDGGGNAGTNNITMVGEGGELIDGEASAVIKGDYDAINLYSDGTNIFIH